MERLQKVMAASGIASRRKCEEIIAQGRVYVNGQKITELGFKVTNKDEIIVDGKPICREEKVYYVLNKPTGYVSTVSDEHDRKTVLDLFEKAHLDKRIYPVGRLDYDTSGVLIMTNDGELTNQLTHTETKVVSDDRYESMLSIVGIPRLNHKASGGDTGQARLLGEGWTMADERAKQDELSFKKSERKMLKLVINICKYKTKDK